MKNLIQRPKTSNGAFNVGYRAGISRKSSSASGTELPVATVGPVDVGCRFGPILCFAMGALRHKGRDLWRIDDPLGHSDATPCLRNGWLSRWQTENKVNCG